MIVFKTLRYKNFLSTGNQFNEIELNKSNTTLIVGTNGSGKSTMLDALTFVLFGKPFRNINKPQLVNSINEKDCLVECEFTINNIDYLVRRGIKPNVIDIQIAGKSLNQNSQIKDQQEYLEKNILRLNYKSFTQIVVLGSSTFVPFMQLPAADRRAIIEDLLDIRIFSAMNVVLKEKISTIKQTLEFIANKEEILKEKQKLIKKHLDDIEKNNQAMLSDIQTDIKHYQDEITKIEKSIQQQQKKLSGLLKKTIKGSELKTKLLKYNNLVGGLDNNYDKINRDIEFLKETEVCPTCTQKIDDNFKTSKINDKKKKSTEIEASKKELNELISKLQQQLKEIEEITQTIQSIQLDIQKDQNTINSYQKYIKKRQEDQTKIVHETTSTHQYETDLLDIDKEMDSYVFQRNGLVDDTHYYNLCSMLLKDNGIKTQIIKQYLPIINKLVNKYLQDMDFFVNFILDEKFSETIKSRYRDIFTYSSFSEGQKKRIDLALLFTWREVAKIKNSTNTNLLILDEVFDSAMDNAGIEDFMKLVNNLGEKTNVFVISPKGDVLYDKFNNIIKFEMVKNFSKMV